MTTAEQIRWYTIMHYIALGRLSRGARVRASMLVAWISTSYITGSHVLSAC